MGGKTHPDGDDVAAARAQLDQLRDRVTNVVGHALATPVATLRGLIDALDAGLPPEKLAEVIAALDRTSARIERLVDDLLVANGIDTRIPPQEAAAVDLAAVVRRCWDQVGEAGGLDLRGDAMAHAPPRVAEWILLQVLDNAARYGDGACEVEIRSTDDQATLVIENGGAPLPPDEVANAFELFYRGHDAVMRVAARLGIGLAVVRRLQDRASATVDLAARDGGGATVTVTFPAAGAA